MKRAVAAVLMSVLLLAGSVSAATIRLNDGSVIMGEVVGSDGSSFKVQSSFGLLSIPAQDVKEITMKDADDSSAVTPQAGSSASTPSGSGPAAGAMEQDFSRMIMSDQKSMDIVMGLANDPEFKAIAADPKIQAAIRAGDLSTLLADPRFMKLLERQEVKDISRRMGK